MTQRLTTADIQSAANRLDIEPASVRAVIEVESTGSGFLSDGHPKVLFERHVMYRRMSEKYGRERADSLFNRDPLLINPRSGGYATPGREPRRLEQAAKLDRDCALESTSWGLFQIMGYHWHHLGYPSLQSFINAMFASEGEHLESFVRFVLADPSLDDHLRSRDWAAFAARYNGPKYAKHKYHLRLASAYAKHSSFS